MKYTTEFEISSHDTDPTGEVRPSVVLRYMQETANHSMRDEGPSYNDLIKLGYSFVLSRIRVCIYKPLHQYDKIVAQSWASSDSRGVSHNRCYRLMLDGEIAAEAASVWALVDINGGGRRLMRISETNFNYSTDEPIALARSERFRIPSDAPLVEVGAHTVSYGEVDINRHLNNTNYPDIFASYIPGIGETVRVSSFALNFLSEAPWRESITICKAQPANVKDTCYFRSVREDGTVNAEAEFVTESITL
jgi:acyl-CoA thioesterase FadM